MSETCGLYVHIPFCDYHCHYCSFVTFLSDPCHVEKYVDYLIQEIQMYADVDRVIDTVYFGGGTPSVLTGEQMTRVMKAIRGNFFLDDRAEISTEMNPESITREKLEIFQTLGFNRFSVGAQSFNNQVLTYMGRLHRRADIFERIGWMKELGMDNISLDLMFNNPGQNLEVLRDDLDQAMSLDINHISIYSLMIEPGTQFERWLKKGQIRIRDDEEERQMYYLIKDTLAAYDFHQYEVSNFARPGKMCRHNLKYWQQEDYLGIGLGASGNIGSMRYDNANNFIDYYDALDRREKPIGERVYLTNQEREVEYIMLAMRLLRGMSVTEMNKRYQINFLEKYKEVILKNKKAGLIILDGDYLNLRHVD